MRKGIFLLMAMALIPLRVLGHAGHDKEVGVFDPPHNGAFAKLSDGFSEVYLSEGKINFCFVELNGKGPDEDQTPKKIVLTITPKHGKTTVLKAATADKDGCASWAFNPGTARLIRVEIEAEIGGETFNSSLMYETLDL